jgi:glutamate/tyrosine decarboxylase-like PLP-dependent enzyme
MVVLKSASQSLQQALHLYRSMYYAENGVRLSETGLAGAANFNVPRPAVLAAVNNNIMLAKAAALVGFGREDLFLYSLNDEFQPDEDSVRDAINRAHASGRRIVAHLAIAGDAERGIVHSARRLDAMASQMCAELGYRPRVIVDAAAQWLNFLMWEKSSEWDLRAENDNISAVIFDPQKVELPFDLSLLLLRDYKDLEALVDPAHCPHPDKRYLLSQANNVLSRGGESIIAAYYYLMNQGLSGLRESRGLIFERSRELADYIRSDPRYTLISEPQGSVVAWRLTDPDPAANWNFIQRINAQQNDRLLLTYNMQCRARTPEQLESSLRGDRSYDGIVAHVMEHNSPSDVRRLIQRLRTDR